MFAQPNGIDFHDRASGRDMVLVTQQGPMFGWLCYRYGNNDWAPLRKATREDLDALGLDKGLSEYMNNDGPNLTSEIRSAQKMEPMLKFNKIIEEAIAAGKITADEVAAVGDSMVNSTLNARMDRAREQYESEHGDGSDEPTVNPEGETINEFVRRKFGEQGCESFESGVPEARYYRTLPAPASPFLDDVLRGLALGSIAGLVSSLFDKKAGGDCGHSRGPQEFIRIGNGIFRRANVETATWDESDGVVSVTMRQPWNTEKPTIDVNTSYDTRAFPPKPEGASDDQYAQAIQQEYARTIDGSIERALQPRKREQSPTDQVIEMMLPVAMKAMADLMVQMRLAPDPDPTIDDSDEEFTIDDLNVGDRVEFFSADDECVVKGTVEGIVSDDDRVIVNQGGARTLAIPFEFVRPIDDNDGEEEADAPGTPE